MIYKNILTWLCLASMAFSIQVVDLKIRENAGIIRTAEDITMGVPLPETGSYTDVSQFSLRDKSGNLIPCEFKSVCSWYKNPTNIRWLQMNFPYSIAANDSAVVTLNYNDPVTLSSKLTAVDSGTFIIVNTGKIRFKIKKTNNNLIDQAWIDESGAENYSDANKIITSHNRGFIYIKQNTEFLSSNDAASTAVIERQGAGQVCVKTTGILKNSGGTGSLYFIVRIYAYNNSPSVRMQSVVEYHHNSNDVKDSLQGLHLEIPLNLGSARNAVVSKPSSFEQSTLTTGQELYCLTKRPDNNPITYATMGTSIEGKVGGTLTATFDPKATKAKDIGWGALSDGSRGCLVGMRWFWQMVPTSVETYADGKIIVGLVSKRANLVPTMFYSGTARSWETQWTFFNSMTPDAMRSRAAAITSRLFALTSPAWYTRQTKGVVRMVEKNQSLYEPDVWTHVNQWETKMNTVWNNVLNWDLSSHYGVDQYGFLEWGDNSHYDASSWITNYPWRILWNGNYYGLDFFALEHFYHTGDVRFLEYGLAHSHHVQDVHMCHFGPGNGDNGSSRYCPPAYHINVDDPPNVLTNRTWNPSHHKTEALWQDYYLTGNDYALQVAKEGANWFNSQGTAYASTGEINQYIRRWAHNMFTIIAAYQHTGSSAYLTTLINNWEAMKTNIRNNATIGQDFMVGLAMEAVVKMYPLLSPTYRVGATTRPDSIPHYLKMWTDRTYRRTRLGNGINANITIACAFLSNFYGTAYRDSAFVFGALAPASPGNLHKDFPQQSRNIEMAMYYLAKPDSVASIAIENRSAISVLNASPEISISPIPFNPSAQITITGLSLKTGSNATLMIYSTNGRLVTDLSGAFRSNGSRVLFNSGELASGVYVIRFQGTGVTAQKRITLIR